MCPPDSVGLLQLFQGVSEIFSEADLDSQSPIFPFNYSPVKRASFDVSEDGAKWGGRSS